MTDKYNLQESWSFIFNGAFIAALYLTQGFELATLFALTILISKISAATIYWRKKVEEG